MKVIDLHTHCNSDSLFDVPETATHKRNFSFLMKEYESADISVGGFSYYSAVLHTEEIYEQNEKLLRQSAEDARVYQWLVLDPRQDALFDQIRAHIHDPKVLGIKIHLSHGYDILEYGDKIFSFANELGCFVLMHPDKMPRMAAFADKYPNMKLIIAHLGSVEHVEAIRAAKHGNIFTDTSGGASTMRHLTSVCLTFVRVSAMYPDISSKHIRYPQFSCITMSPSTSL